MICFVVVVACFVVVAQVVFCCCCCVCDVLLLFYCHTSVCGWFVCVYSCGHYFLCLELNCKGRGLLLCIFVVFVFGCTCVCVCVRACVRVCVRDGSSFITCVYACKRAAHARRTHAHSFACVCLSYSPPGPQGRNNNRDGWSCLSWTPFGGSWTQPRS